jgi:phosphoribosylformylglycinamidine synthase
MDHITLPGDECFTKSEAKKLTERVKKLGFAVNEIRGVWMHYTHLQPSDQRNDNVSPGHQELSQNQYFYFT